MTVADSARTFCAACTVPLAGGPYCPQCGTLQTDPSPSAERDEMVGRTVADRYVVVELIKAGGMGRVYRAVQRSLERSVAIKLIRPQAVEAAGSDEITQRFMAEARMASRLNHPNVVSVFDFGLTEEGQLYLVMEYLPGPSLADVLSSGVELKPARIATILERTLAALGEAHFHGITHRDVKPENIILKHAHGGSDVVKVIDFGIAKASAGRSLTTVGRLVGTPHYMAPEQALGAAASPSMDLYAVGVILFEMLTGEPPFDAASAMRVLEMQSTAARPDPRTRRGNVSPPLAEVCVRAMAIDPKDRYPDAESLAMAIVAASAASWTARDSSLFPAQRQERQLDGETAPLPRTSSVRPSVLPRGPSFAPPAGAMALAGRDEHLALAKETLRDPRDVMALVFWGPTGMGRTRLLQEVLLMAGREGAPILHVPAVSAPRSELSFAGLRSVVTVLAGEDGRPPNEEEATDPRVSLGLRALYAGNASGAAGDTRRHAPAVLRWAAARAARRARGGPVVVSLDDVDRCDAVSTEVLMDFLQGECLKGVLLVVTCEKPPLAKCVRDLEVTGISRADAGRLLGRGGKEPDRTAAEADRRIAPLYLEQHLRWREEVPQEAVPRGLLATVGARLELLDPVQRRLLQAVAVGGSCQPDALEAISSRPEEVQRALRGLEAGGFVDASSGPVRLTHAIFGQLALASAPSGAVAKLHALAADGLKGSTLELELRAYHAIRGRPDFEAFMLVEEAARLRAARGDAAGGIRALAAGFAASRQAERYDTDFASSAWAVLGRKLGEALLAAGRLDEAYGVLSEIAPSLAVSDGARDRVLEQLANIADQRGQQDSAYRWRTELAAPGRAPVEARVSRPAPRRSVSRESKK